MAVPAMTDAARRDRRQRSAAGPKRIGGDGKPAATSSCGWKSRASPRRRPSQPDQALLQRLEHRLAAGVNFELAVDVLDVAGPGLARQYEMAGDLGVAYSLGDTPEYIAFPLPHFPIIITVARLPSHTPHASP